MAATGNIEIDFGSTPTNEASVAVTGQAGILSTHAADALLMAETSTDYTANDQAYAKLFMTLSCSVPTDGVGFTIYARATEKFTGKFKARWVWA